MWLTLVFISCRPDQLLPEKYLTKGKCEAGQRFLTCSAFCTQARSEELVEQPERQLQHWGWSGNPLKVVQCLLDISKTNTCAVSPSATKANQPNQPSGVSVEGRGAYSLVLKQNEADGCYEAQKRWVVFVCSIGAFPKDQFAFVVVFTLKCICTTAVLLKTHTCH